MRQQILHAHLAVRRSNPGKGYGLFATSMLNSGDFILEYKGRHVPSETADRLKTRYLFEINETWTIDGSSRANTARYINHSCEPNCEASLKDGRVMIYAMREIKNREELTIDYGEEYFNEFIKPYGCKCRGCIERISKASSQTGVSRNPGRRFALWRRS